MALCEMHDGVTVESQDTVTLEYDLSKGASRPENPPPEVSTSPFRGFTDRVSDPEKSVELAAR